MRARAARALVAGLALLAALGGVSPVRARCRGYEQTIVGGVLNIGPAGSFERSRILKTRTKEFAVAGVPLCDTLGALHRLLDPGFNQPGGSFAPRLMQQRSRAGSAATADDLTKPVSVKVPKATLRDVLNALVSAHGSACWVAEQRPDGLNLSFQDRNGTSIGLTHAPRR